MAGVTAILVRAAGLTLITVCPDMLPTDAVIVELPVATALALPEAEIVTADTFVEAHLAVALRF